jgi:hypothetical protein
MIHNWIRSPDGWAGGIVICSRCHITVRGAHEAGTYTKCEISTFLPRLISGESKRPINPEKPK